MSASTTASGGGGGPCGACKFLRRKCLPECLFAPYFDPDKGAANFAAVHRVFGSSNFAKLLQQVPHHKRLDTVVTVCYEAQARLKEPVYGCVANIIALERQVATLQRENAHLKARLAVLELQSPPPPPETLVAPPPFSVAAASPSAMPGFAPPWTMEQPGIYQQHALGEGNCNMGALTDILSPTQSDLQMLAHAFLDNNEFPFMVEDAMNSGYRHCQYPQPPSVSHH